MMALFALYHRIRPWEETDTHLTILFLTLLFLLILFFKGRSLLANGTFLGGVLGCLAAWQWGSEYADRQEYIESGYWLGFLAGAAARVLLNMKKWNSSGTDLPAGKCEVRKDSYYWTLVLAITGISLGLTLALAFQLSYQAMFLTMAGLALTGCVIGAVIRLTGTRFARIEKYFELLAVLALAGGTGAVIGWKMLYPVLAFDINPPLSSDVLFRIAVLSCGGLGAMVGLIAWGVGVFRNRAR